MPTAPFVLRALGAAALLSVAACRLERAPSGRPSGTAPTAADSLTRVELDSASADRVRGALRAHYRSDSARAEMVEAGIHTYGDVAQAWVVVRARTGSRVEALTLERVGGVWRIASRMSAAEDPDRPLAVRRP